MAPIDPELGFDLDEDLFDFDEALADHSSRGEDEDLDEIFAAFASEAKSSVEAASPSDTRAEPHAGRAPSPLAATRPMAPGQPPASTGMSRGILLLIVGAMAMNGMVALLMLRSTSQVQNSIQREVGNITDAARTLRDETIQRIPGEAVPIAAPNPDNHPTFDLVRDDIAQGEYSRARQRLYSLLSIVDRLDPSEREAIEARANYLMAQALHLEALTQEATRP